MAREKDILVLEKTWTSWQRFIHQTGNDDMPVSVQACALSASSFTDCNKNFLNFAHDSFDLSLLQFACKFKQNMFSQCAI